MGFNDGSKIPKEILFLKRVFRDHYSNFPVDPPYRFPRREWGFFPFGGKMMFRHISFQRRTEINDFFRDTAPMHAYYSVAYYGDPSMQPMGDKFKTWMGADLIFDLDADHLPNADEMTYQQQLEKVKEEVGKLLFDFILEDLGLPEESTHLHFSGGRGYHVHVRDAEVLQLDSRDRRGIVDYITGRGLDLEKLFPKVTVSVNQRFGTHKERRKFPKVVKGGWARKILDGRDRLIKEMESKDEKENIKLLLEIADTGKLKIGKDMCKSILNHQNNFNRLLDTTNFDVFERPQQLESFLKLVVAYSSVNLSGETDEPVTTDIKRLIRCPGSLHGKTGMIVMEVDKDKLDDYDPLRDAVSLSDDPIKVMVPAPVEQYLGGEHFNLKEGETEVPLFMAYFMIARRLATLP